MKVYQCLSLIIFLASWVSALILLTLSSSFSSYSWRWLNHKTVDKAYSEDSNSKDLINCKWLGKNDFTTDPSTSFETQNRNKLLKWSLTSYRSCVRVETDEGLVTQWVSVSVVSVSQVTSYPVLRLCRPGVWYHYTMSTVHYRTVIWRAELGRTILPYNG